MNEQKLGLLQNLFSIAALCAVVAGCTTAARAPVEDRSVPPGRAPSVAAVPAAPTVAAAARPGYHIVKRGETLFAIALEYGQDYRDVAAWNNIDNPGVISVGQELRVVPPDGTTSKALPVTSGIEMRPLDSSKALPPVQQSGPLAAPSATAPTAAIKQEPKGGRVPYSPQALSNLQNAGSQSEPAAGEAKPATGAQSEPKAAPAVGSDDVEWIWPAKGNVLATFNEATNKGVDIAGAIGEPVLAAGPGRVVYVGNGLRGYGNLVIIKHNNAFLSAYAHNSEIAVKEGQSVQKGQKIAELGNTDADRPKLHFEIRRQGKPVDPLKFLPAR